MIKKMINGISSFIYIGMSCWEFTIVSLYPSFQRDINDLVLCFLYSIAIMNLLMGITSFYVFIIQFIDKEKTEQHAITISTGMSLWGLILFFRYDSSIYNSHYYPILYCETILFFTRIGMVLVLGCGSCFQNKEDLPSL